MVIGFFEEPIMLKSGRKSHFYANWRTVAEDAFLLEKLAKFVLDFAKKNKIEVDTFYGVPEGATKVGIIAQMMLARKSPNYGKGSHVLAMGRGKEKEHGEPKDKYFLGLPKGKTVVIEDVTTTGGSLIKAIDALRAAGVQVEAVVSLTNRNEKRDDGKSVKEAIEEKGVKFFEMSSALKLLPLAFKEMKENEGKKEEIKKAIEEEFKYYGMKKLKLI